MFYLVKSCRYVPKLFTGFQSLALKNIVPITTASLLGTMSDVQKGLGEVIHDGKDGHASGKRKLGKKEKKNHPKKMFKSSYEERFDETDYYFDKGFRRVTPYVYAFETHAKGRWFERKLLDIFKKEFRLETPAFYAKAIETGLIKVNGQRTSADYIVKNNDFIHSKCHRHEPPVTSDPIHIVESSDEFVVINKPASIPVHPCGKYRHNTVVFLLAKEHKLMHLHTIHRLDRLTSGLLIFARTKAASQRMDAYFRERKVKKTYVCKVNGEFPSSIECSEPILIVSHKIGVCRVRAEGKPCKTRFERISYDGETSIVKCFPETGRMHQIRVHLQYLGYPIQNDPLYNNPVWGPLRGQGGGNDISNEQLLDRLVDQHDEEKIMKVNEFMNERLAKENKDKPCLNELMETRTRIHEMKPPLMDETANGDLRCMETTEIPRMSNAYREQESSICKLTSNSGELRSMENTEISGMNNSHREQESSICKLTSSSGDLRSMETTEISGMSNAHREQELSICKLKSSSGNLRLLKDDLASRSVYESENELSNIHSLEEKRIHSEEDLDKRGDSTPCPKPSGKESLSLNINANERTLPTETGYPKDTTQADEGSIGSDTPGLITMDGTLRGIGVLEVDEQKLAVLAEEGSENSVDEIARMLCRECVTPLADPKPDEMMIFLHALTYKGPDFEISTPMPKWASEHIEKSSEKLTNQHTEK